MNQTYGLVLEVRVQSSIMMLITISIVLLMDGKIL